MKRHHTVDLILGSLFVAGCLFLTSGEAPAGACDNKCRKRYKFLQLGAGGWCVNYTNPTCLWCVGTGYCLTSNPVDGILPCYDYGAGNEYTNVSNCTAACDNIPQGTATSEANGTPTGFSIPSDHNVYWCTLSGE